MGKLKPSLYAVYDPVETLTGSILVGLIGSLMVLCVAMSCHAAEVENELLELENTARDSQSLPRKVLKNESRLLPVPIPISNPTVGAGLAVAGIYLHPQEQEDTTGSTTTSGVLGMYTNTESWAVGGFHDGYYRDDRIRFRAAGGYGEFNLDYYGIGNDSLLKDNPLSFKARGTVFMPRLLFRLPGENWYLGGQYDYFGVEAMFDLPGLVPFLPEYQSRTQTSGLGLVGVYDTRDNNLWPSKGAWFEGTASAYGGYIGGDFDYRKMVLKFAQYLPLPHAVTFVYRLDAQFIGGEAPFYDLSQMKTSSRWRIAGALGKK